VEIGERERGREREREGEREGESKRVGRDLLRLRGKGLIACLQ
jgi:hypothetical protein